MKISQRSANLVFATLTAVFMSFLMSLVITFINLGLIDGFVLKWLKAWGYGFIVGYPVMLIVLPIVRKIINKLAK